MATPIGVGIVGAHPSRGWASTAHIPALLEIPEYSIVAVSNSDPLAARAAATQFRIPYAFQNARDLAECAEVDLVVIAVKVPRHLELVSAALDAGKMVFCEWPLGNGLQEAIDLERLAEERAIRTFVGLQSRASAELRYMRDLVRNNYVGEALSVTLTGSGIIGGAEISEAFKYTLDPANGAGILNVAFAHAMDSLCFVLDDAFDEVVATLSRRRKTARVVETGEMIAMRTPDQITVAGTLKKGPVVSAHVRGGLSRGTNFQMEINGTRGDLILTGSLGYPGVGVSTLRGASDNETGLRQLGLPDTYLSSKRIEGPAENVFRQYLAIAADLTIGTSDVASFADAVKLHRFIDTVEQAAVRGLQLRV